MTEPSQARLAGRARTWWSNHWHLLVIAFVWLWIFPYSQQLNNPNERTRVLQARALVGEGTLAIGRIEATGTRPGRMRWSSTDTYGNKGYYDADSGHAFVNDVALVCDDRDARPPACTGRVFPAKPPGAALLGVPALALADALGVVRSGPEGEAEATWVLRYGGVALPMFLCLLAFAALLRRAGVPEAWNRRMVLVVGLGTTLLPYATSFVGHALAGGSVIAAAAVLAGIARPAAPRTYLRDSFAAIMGGMLTAAAVLFEYHAFLAVVPIGFWVLLSPARARLVPGFAVGALAVLAVHVVLHQSMFGSALQTGHHHLMSAHNRASQAGGFLGIEMFSPRALVDVLFDPYMGLLWTMPWVVVAGLVGYPFVFSRQARADVAAGLPLGLLRALAVIPILYLVFVSSLGQWQTMNGWSLGPRYLVPALMPLTLVAALGWFHLIRHAPNLARLVAGLGVASMVIIIIATAAVPSPPDSARNTFGELAWPLLKDGWGPRTPGAAFGVDGVWPAFVVAGLGAVAVLAGRDGVRLRWRGLAVGAAIAVVWVGAVGFARPSDPGRAADARRFSESIHEGTRPGGAGRFW